MARKTRSNKRMSMRLRKQRGGMFEGWGEGLGNKIKSFLPWGKKEQSSDEEEYPKINLNPPYSDANLNSLNKSQIVPQTTSNDYYPNQRLVGGKRRRRSNNQKSKKSKNTKKRRSTRRK